MAPGHSVCAVFYPDSAIVLGGRKFGFPSKYDTIFFYSSHMLGEPSVQISFLFNRKQTADASISRLQQNARFGSEASGNFQLSVRFDPNTFTSSGALLSGELHQAIFNEPAGDEKMYAIRLTMLTGKKPVLVNVGAPFIGDDDEINRLFSEGGLLDHHVTLRDIFLQREFHFLTKDVKALHMANNQFAREFTPKFPHEYPYGSRHEWDIARYRKQIDWQNSNPFQAMFVHDSQNHAQTAITQSAIQDVFFIVEDVVKMRKEPVQVRFMRVHTDSQHAMYDKEFLAALQIPYKENYSMSFPRVAYPGSQARLAFEPEKKTEDHDDDKPPYGA